MGKRSTTLTENEKENSPGQLELFPNEPTGRSNPNEGAHETDENDIPWDWNETLQQFDDHSYKLNLDNSAWVDCSTCGGSGLQLNYAGEPDTCRSCNGDTTERRRDSLGRYASTQDAPRFSDPRGLIPSDTEGEGWVE